MAKIKRKEVNITTNSWNLEDEFEQEMSRFDDVEVINIHVLKSKDEGGGIKTECYLVFYKESE